MFPMKHQQREARKTKKGQATRIMQAGSWSPSSSLTPPNYQWSEAAVVGNTVVENEPKFVATELRCTAQIAASY